MNKDNFVKFLNKHFDIMFEGLPWVMGIGVGLMLIGAIVLFICVAPFVVCMIVGFWVLCYMVGFIREKGLFDPDLGWYARNGKDKIKRWRTGASKKLKSITITYLKPIKDLWSFTKNDWE